MKPLLCFAVLVLTSAKYGVAEEKKAAEARHFESHNKHETKYSHTLDLHPAYQAHEMLNLKGGVSPVFNKASNQHVIDLLNVGGIKDLTSDPGKPQTFQWKTQDDYKQGSVITKNSEGKVITLGGDGKEHSFNFGKLNGKDGIVYGKHNGYELKLNNLFPSVNNKDLGISHSSTEKYRTGLSSYGTQNSFSHFGSDYPKGSNFGGPTNIEYFGIADSNFSPKHISESNKFNGAVVEHANTVHTSVNLEYLGNEGKAAKTSYGGTIQAPYEAKLNVRPQVVKLEPSKHEFVEGINNGKHETEKKYHFKTHIGSISAGKPSGANVAVYSYDHKTKPLIDSTKLNFGAEIDYPKTYLPDKVRNHGYGKPVAEKDAPLLKYQLVQKKPATESELLQKAVGSGTVIIKHVPVAYAEYIDKPYPLKVYVEKPFLRQKVVKVPFKVEIPKPIAVEKEIPFPVEVFEQEPKPYPVYKDIPVPVTVYVDKPVPKYVEKPYPVKVVKGIEHKALALENHDSEDSKHTKPLTWEEFEAVKASAEKSFSEYYKKHTDAIQSHKLEEKIQDKTVAQNDDWKSFETDKQHTFEPIVGNTHEVQNSSPEDFTQKWNSLEVKPEFNEDKFKTWKFSDDKPELNNEHIKNWKSFNTKPESHNYDFQNWKSSEVKPEHNFETLSENNAEALNAKQYQQWQQAKSQRTAASDVSENKYPDFKGHHDTTSNGVRWSPQIREVYAETGFGNSDDYTSKYLQAGQPPADFSSNPGKYLDEFKGSEGSIVSLKGIQEIGSNHENNPRFLSDYTFDPVSFASYAGEIFDEKHSLAQAKESKHSNLLSYGDESQGLGQLDQESLTSLGYFGENNHQDLSAKSKPILGQFERQSNEEILKTLDTDTSASEHVTTKKQLPSATSEKQKIEHGFVPIKSEADKKSSENGQVVADQKPSAKSTQSLPKVDNKRRQRRARNPATKSKQHETSSASSSKHNKASEAIELKKDFKEPTTETSVITMQSGFIPMP